MHTVGAVGTLSVFNTQFHFISLFVKTSLFSTVADGLAAAKARVSHRSVEPHALGCPWPPIVCQRRTVLSSELWCMHQDQLRVQCVAQEYFSMQTGTARDRTSNLLNNRWPAIVCTLQSPPRNILKERTKKKESFYSSFQDVYWASESLNSDFSWHESNKLRWWRKSCSVEVLWLTQ